MGISGLVLAIKADWVQQPIQGSSLGGRYPSLFVKVLFIHGFHSPFSSRSHQATERVPSDLT